MFCKSWLVPTSFLCWAPGKSQVLGEVILGGGKSFEGIPPNFECNKTFGMTAKTLNTIYWKLKGRVLLRFCPACRLLIGFLLATVRTRCWILIQQMFHRSL